MIERLPQSWTLALYRLLRCIRPAPLAVLLKRLAGVHRISVNTGEGTFWVDPVSILGQTLMLNGKYEIRTANVLRALLHDGSVFIDLGANEGYFSIIGSRLVGTEGRVYAVEPQNRLHHIILRNMELNAVSNVHVRNYAIGGVIGKTSLYLAPDTNTGSSGFYKNTKYRLRVQTVQTITLDELLERENIPVCDVMKIDIEGAEYEAILGSPNVFETSRIRALILESHVDALSDQGRTAEDITNFLAHYGYARDLRFPDSSVWRPSEVKSTPSPSK